MQTSQIIIYADGACKGNPGPGGWGAVICKDFVSVKEIGGYANWVTNNRMELTAAINALKEVIAEKRDIIICTDSSYVINGITKWIPTWIKNNWLSSTNEPVANQDLWQLLMNITNQIDQKRIRWQYTKGHAGIPGNERADTIASAFSLQKPVTLYSGSYQEYSFDLTLPLANEIKSKQSPIKNKSEKTIYLSLINGNLQEHATWEECSKRVLGKKGALFQKARNPQEVAEILKKWGVSSPSK